MSKFTVIIAAMGALVLATGCAWAAPDSGPDSGPDASVAAGDGGIVAAPPAPKREAADPRLALINSTDRLRQIETVWRLRMEKVKDGDEERADDLIKRLENLRKHAGIVRMDSRAIRVALEGRKAAKAGDYVKADARIAAAHRLAHNLPEVFDIEAQVSLEKQKLAVHRWLGFKVKAFRAELSDFHRRMLLLSDLTLTMFILFGVLGFVFLLSQAARYGLNLYHDLGDVFPALLRGLLIATVALLALLPLYFGFGPLMFAFPLAILLWSYQSRAEKLCMMVFIVLAAATPWMFRVGDRLTEAGTGVSGAMSRLSVDPGDRQALEQVETATAKNADDWQVLSVLGLAHKRAGRLAKAEKTLKLAKAVAPTAARGAILNNLGNVYFGRGLMRLAESTYMAAAKRLPDSPEPVFNLHRLYLRIGNKAKAAEFGKAASKLDAQRVSAWTEDDDPGLNRYVVDTPLPESAWAQRALADVVRPTPFARRLWIVFAGPVPAVASAIAGGATFLMLALLSASRRRMRVKWPCERCGQPAVVWLSDGFPNKPTCETCDSMFVRNVPVDRALRFAKEQSISRYRSIARGAVRAGGVFLPGLARLLCGQPLRGLLVLGLALLITIRLFLPEGLLLEPFSSVVDPGGFSWTLLVVLGLVWIASGWHAWRMAGDRY